MKTALTIAGSDSSGGAGIQADIKTMLANGVYAMSVISALTAQNTTCVADIMEVTEDFFSKQLDCVITDIFPDAVKTGMLPTSGIIKITADKLKQYDVKNIVVDTVMISTSGHYLIKEEAVEALKTELFPIATVITPNIPEAQALTGMKIESDKEMVAAAKQLYDTFGCAVLLKGGHSINDANDLLYDGKETWFSGNRIDNPNTHGTGCTLSSAIASNLAKGCELNEAIRLSKKYIEGALSSMLDLGHGAGPLDHGFAISGDYR